MAKFVKGEVVVVPFPSSDLTTAKRRPALVHLRIGNNREAGENYTGELGIVSPEFRI